MRKAVTLFAVLAALAWSGIVWGGYALLAGAGAFVAQNAGVVGLPAETAEVAAWAQLLFDSFGQGAAILVWLLGLGLIGVVWLAVRSLAGRMAPSRARYEERAEERVPPRVEPVPPAAPGAPTWGRNASRR